MKEVNHIISWENPKNIKPNPKNRNKHDKDQIDRLCKLITEHGWRQPLIVSKRSGKLVVGHGRLLAAKQLGIERVPVAYQDFASEEEEYQFGVADNAIASWAELDISGIHTDISELGPFDLDLLGIKDFQLEPEPSEKDADETPEVPKEAKTKRGELWMLGNHRLLIDDCTVKENVDRLMGGEKADMVFTDPPYGMNLDTDYSKMGSSGLKHKKVLGDNEDFRDELITSIFKIECDEVFLFGADYFSQLLPNRNDGSWIAWDKRSKSETEIGTLDGAFGSDFELVWSKNKHKREIARILRETGAFSSRGLDKSVHPTQKPIALAEWFFERWGKGKTNIIDLYLGSGSTLIACEKTNRKCYGTEIEPLYGDVIIQRWEKYTGKQAVREDGVKWLDLA